MNICRTGSHMRTGETLLILGLCLLLHACSRDVPEIPYLLPQETILAFGDSLTYGTGAAREESYPAVLSRAIERKVINAGEPGETTVQGVRRLPILLERHQPRLLLLCHGGNDLLRKIERRQTIRNLRTMIEQAKAQGVDVILIAVPKPAILLNSADFYAEIAAEYEIPVELSVLSDILADAGLKSDAIHPNAQGYAVLAQAVEGLLKKTGAIK